ncbi:hypothetical protein AAIH11_35560, partial [Pseudomonas aeruginosa]|uniref:hypothetical protein n=1 Tax=Pseudomonas aeruginosa TaxID=287 RepID=UPI0031B67F8A
RGTKRGGRMLACSLGGVERHQSGDKFHENTPAEAKSNLPIMSEKRHRLYATSGVALAPAFTCHIHLSIFKN